MRATKTIAMLLALGMFLGMGAIAQATDIQWVGGDADWNASTANWSPAQFPAYINGSNDEVVIDNNATVTISSDANTARLGLGMSTQDGFFVGAGGNGKVIQTAGTLTSGPPNNGRVALGGNGGVGIFQLEGGSVTSGENTYIANNNSSALPWAGNVNPLGDASASGVTQTDGYFWTKNMSICRAGNNCKGFYSLEGGTLWHNQWELALANSGSGQQGIFSQTGGLYQGRGIKMGGGVGGTGKAIVSLEGGVWENRIALSGIKFNSASSDVYFDIAGGTLRQSGAITLADMLALPNSDFRSYGAPISAANLVFTPEGNYTLITGVAPVLGEIPEPVTMLALFAGLAGLGRYVRRRKTVVALLGVGMFLGMGATAQAADLYWDGNGTTAGFGDAAPGTWGTDSYWTTDSTGAFSDTPGTATTTASDRLIINKGDYRSGGVVIDVKGDQSALGILNPNGNSGAAVTINEHADGGAIHFHGVGTANPIMQSGGNDAPIIIKAPVVLEQAAGSDVYMGTPAQAGGNNHRFNLEGGLSSVNSVNLIYSRNGNCFITGDISGLMGTFTSLDSNTKGRGPIIDTVIGSGITDITENGAGGGLTLNQAGNAYTGDTTVLAGTLHTNTATSLPNTTDVYLSGAGIFHLNFTGTDTIASLYFDGIGQAAGTWGAVGNASADYTSAFLTGDGLLLVPASAGEGDIPEPATMLAVFAGLAGLGGYVKRRRSI